VSARPTASSLRHLLSLPALAVCAALTLTACAAETPETGTSVAATGPASAAGEPQVAWMWEEEGRPIGFDPCQPIHYVTDLDQAPPTARTLLDDALAKLGEASGLRFVDDGPTDEAPSDDRPERQDRYGDRWAPVLVTWLTEAEDPELKDDTAGYATPIALDPDGSGSRIVTGQVVMDSDVTDRDLALMTLLHELGHLVGLDHVDDPTEIMHADSEVPPVYTPGALKGLAELGENRCFS
jgi:hypothetical protein